LNDTEGGTTALLTSVEDISEYSEKREERKVLAILNTDFNIKCTLAKKKNC
jgi:hypothetical protein